MKGLCRTAVGLILFCFFLTVWPRLAAAQAGEITGVVVDATGGVLPGATVTLSGGPIYRGRCRRMRAAGSRSRTSRPGPTR